MCGIGRTDHDVEEREKKMNRDHFMMLTDNKPFNVKRKSVSKQHSMKSSNTPKLSMQDFVRMDPGYTPDIEHLVFPARKRNPQQVAPINPIPGNKTRSRLAEMFALSRHLQQRSADRENKTRNPAVVNRSMDSVLESTQPRSDTRRWVAPVEEPVRQNSNITSRLSPAAESADMATTRGPNVSILHLRSTSEPWETSPTTVFRPNRPPPLTKHQSLGSTGHYNWNYNHSSNEANSEFFVQKTCNRELSPVRWCNREVDGVYLGRSGWVQVQQRSLDDNRRNYTPSSLQSRRTAIKLADYHCNSEPGTEPPRPVYLSLQPRDFDRIKTPSPQPIPESFSPPSITPIISPPPAFQDRNKKTRKFFGGKMPFLPRSNAIVESDLSPPGSPNWANSRLKSEERTYRIPQTKSLEDTTAVRRIQFKQRESSSSSSSSMGFRSLDSCVNRMPRLSENTDSSIDCHEDADEEDNNSSSLNINVVSAGLSDYSRIREKILPSNRSVNRLTRRRSPVNAEDKAPNSPGSSSTSSNEFLSKSPSGSTQPVRRAASKYQQKASQEDASRVRRSRSLQLPDKKSPNLQDKKVVRVSPSAQTEHRSIKVVKKQKGSIDEDMLREAEVVTGFLYGNRSRAAAQALLMHRYNNNLVKSTEKTKEPVKTSNGLTVYFIGNGKIKEKKMLHRGCTTPNFAKTNPCNSETCDFWPHCAHRESLNREAHFMMRSSQSYPTHQRSLDSQDHKKRSPQEIDRRRPQSSAFTSNRPKCFVETERKFNANSSLLSDVKCFKNQKISTSLEDNPIKTREMILTRPGSAPTSEEKSASFLESQQRSMSLPKSFLSATYQQGGQLPWHRRGTESLDSSPGLPRKTDNTETAHTAPVTPLHEGSRRRSPLGGAVRRAKATSTPQLLDAPENRKWNERNETNDTKSGNNGRDFSSRRHLPAESVLQKFRKTFSLRFQKKSSKDSCSSDIGETLSEILGEPSEEDSPQHLPSGSSSTTINNRDDQPEQKSRFGPLIWRSSKDRKKLNKAARNAKCNSGDSGIQIEMMPNCGGTGDSSESHDTDAPADELDSPPSVRRRPPHTKTTRPHSDLLNQVLIDKFKSDLKQRTHRHHQVRRTRSDLGGQRLLHWDPRSSYKRLMSSPTPLRQSPRKKPPDAPVLLRANHKRGQLRRSLSQPLDIDKLSPLMRTKTNGLKLGTHVLSEDEHDGRIGTSDDEIMSDSESSITSLTDRKKSLELAMDEEMIILAEAVFDHVAIEAEELAFRAGDVIEVLETANRDWWWGSTKGTSGWFPAQFVRLRVSQEDTVEDCLEAMASGRSVTSQIRRRTSISLLSNDQVRTSVVRELVHTERDFVKVLQDVAEGYIAECRKRADMFNEEQIRRIYINLEEILRFQSGFLKDLEAEINWEAPYKSCVGGCFLKHKSGFKMYSEYCNSHPMATAALQELYQFNNYSKFFEACRLMRGLIEIPLDGYLLTPVQRICKYPLQLAELLKYTKTDHNDYENIKEALEVMRGVAVLINERKRRMESLEKLAAWQQRVEGWEGEDLIEVSSQLIHQGDVVKVTTGMWTNNITLFLFDHQIVYCKKDILKRNTYVYKGRICLDTSEVIDIADGKDIHLGVSVRHAIKVYSCVRDKWLLFCCRSSSDKQKWLKAFTEERKLVAQDKHDGLEFPPAARQLARVAARCQRRPPRKPRGFLSFSARFTKVVQFRPGGKSYKYTSYMGSSLQLNSNSLGRKVGTWFTFGTHKNKTRQVRDVS